MTEDKMVGWHHQHNGHDLEQTLGDSEGQGSLVCCSPWGRRVRHDLVAEQQSEEPGRLDFLSMEHTRVQKAKIPKALYKNLDGTLFTLNPVPLLSF